MYSLVDVCTEIYVMMSSDLYGTCVNVITGLDGVTGLGSGISDFKGLDQVTGLVSGISDHGRKWQTCIKFQSSGIR